jgi:hypothetical protein
MICRISAESENTKVTIRRELRVTNAAAAAFVIDPV